MTDTADDSQMGSAPLAPGAELGHYEILRSLGAGGMGQVYLATDTKLHREVALKFLPDSLRTDSEARERLLREARATSRLNHKNIVTVHAVENAEGHDFIVMEYIDGQPLSDLIAPQKLSAQQIVRIALHLADGLSAAHEEAIVHRDLKPGNIFITSKDQVKIMDFGLATWRGAAKLTKDGSTVGTMAYISPEQAKGGDVDPRSDLFSLGTLLYEMSTGHTPFSGDHEAALIYAIVNEEPEPMANPVAGLPSGMPAIIEKLLQKDLAARYQSAHEVIVDLKRVKMESFSSVTPMPSTASMPSIPAKSSMPKFVVPAAVVVVIAILLLVFKPWSIEVSSTHEAKADDNLLAVMYFENFADPEDSKRLGEIAANLLITDLSQSQYMKVVSGQRLYDILKNIGMEGTKVIDKEVATRVARDAHARWMLTGSILQTEPQLVITTQLIEVETGNVITSQKSTGSQGETIFDLVDDLTVAIKKDLSLPDAAMAEVDPSVSDITSSSWDAYRFYIEGMDDFYRYKHREAEEQFRAALALDSSFAMAHYGLSLARSISAQEQIDAIDEAVKHVGRANRREREFILARHANLHGDFDEAIERLQGIVDEYPEEKEAHFRIARIYQLFRDEENLKRFLFSAIAADSLFKDAYNVLAYTYATSGQPDSAMWAINKYLEIAPEESNPYDSRGDVYGLDLKLDEAILSFERAIEIDPEYADSRLKLAAARILRREYSQADSQAQFLLASPNKNHRSTGRSIGVSIALQQGQFADAIRQLDHTIEANTIEDCSPVIRAMQISVRSRVHEYLGDFASALRDAREAMRIVRAEEPHHFARKFIEMRVPALLASSGDSLASRKMLADIQMRFQSGDSVWMSAHLKAQGRIYLELGETQSAISDIEEGLKLYPAFVSLCDLAHAYHAVGRLGDAVETFEKAALHFDVSRNFNNIVSVLAYYHLGKLYEESGWNDKAAEQYEIFLSFWGDADRETGEIKDARERLAKLKTSS